MRGHRTFCLAVGAVTLLLALPESSDAQVRVGVGRGRVAVGVGGPVYGYSGYSGYGPYYSNYYGYGPYGYAYRPYYSTWGTTPYYNYGYSTPYYYGTTYYPQYAYSYPRYTPNYMPYSSSPILPSGYVERQAFSINPGQPAISTSRVEVKVPVDNAQVIFDGTPTRQTGMVRTFTTPALEPGRTYHYEVQAKWTENGQPVEKTRTLSFKGGEPATIDFTKP